LKNIFKLLLRVGGKNIFLTLVSKTDQSGSMLFKSGDSAGQGDVEVTFMLLKP
jgi:hypothetical protein